jgi:hypothetical protein
VLTIRAVNSQEGPNVAEYAFQLHKAPHLPTPSNCSKRNEEVASIRMAATGLELRIKSPLPQRQISSFQFRSISSCSLT